MYNFFINNKLLKKGHLRAFWVSLVWVIVLSNILDFKWAELMTHWSDTKATDSHDQTVKIFLILGMFAAIAGTQIGTWIKMKDLVHTTLLTIGAIASIIAYAQFDRFDNQYMSTLFIFFGSFSMLLFVRKTKFIAHKMALRTSLSRTFPKNIVNLALKNKENLNLKGKQTYLTVLSIEFVGINELAQKIPTDNFFNQLRNYYENIVTIIHKHGGFVHPGFQRGIQCYFGDYIFPNSVTSAQADHALLCAIEIQHGIVSDILQSKGTDRPRFAAKIGIASSTAILGNLGNPWELELTVLGRAVEESHQLAQNCLANTVRFSNECKNILTSFDTTAYPIRTSHIRINSEEREVFDVNPFWNLKDTSHEAIHIFRDIKQFQRSERRWKLKDFTVINVDTNFGPAKILNVSLSGIGIALVGNPVDLQQIDVNLAFKNPDIQKKLAQQNLLKFSCEIKWKDKDKLRLGMVYKELSAPQKEVLLQSILESQSTISFNDVG